MTLCKWYVTGKCRKRSFR